MSSFMCSNADFDVIAQVAVREGFGNHGRISAMRNTDNLQDAIGRILCKANADGQRDRYDDDESACVEAYRWTARRDVSPVQLLKVCQCYSYQTCEWRGWEGSDAQKIVQFVEGWAIGKLPGYEAAAWGLPEDHPLAEVVHTLPKGGKPEPDKVYRLL